MGGARSETISPDLSLSSQWGRPPLWGPRQGPPDLALHSRTLLADQCHPTGGRAQQTVNHHHCLPGPSLTHTLKGKDKNLPAPAPPHARREAGAAEEKEGLYAHGQEGTTSPPSPPVMPSGERSLCEVPGDRPEQTHSPPGVGGSGGQLGGRGCCGPGEAVTGHSGGGLKAQGPEAEAEWWQERRKAILKLRRSEADLQLPRPVSTQALTPRSCPGRLPAEPSQGRAASPPR